MKKTLTLLMGILILTAYSLAEVRIGFVNTQQILSNTKIGIQVSKKLETKQKEEREKLLVLQTKIDKLEKELKSGTLDKPQMQSKSKDLFNVKRELKSKYDQLTEDFQKYTQTEIKALEEKVNPVIQEIGRSKGYTAIYDIQRSGTIYIDMSVNITKEVIDAINQKYPQ